MYEEVYYNCMAALRCIQQGVGLFGLGRKEGTVALVVLISPLADLTTSAIAAGMDKSYKTASNRGPNRHMEYLSVHKLSHQLYIISTVLKVPEDAISHHSHRQKTIPVSVNSDHWVWSVDLCSGSFAGAYEEPHNQSVERPIVYLGL